MEQIRSLGPMSMLLPAVNYANMHIASPGVSYGPRTIPDHQFVFVVSGCMDLSIGDGEYEIHPGEFAYYGPDTPHKLSIRADRPATFISVHFDWHRMSSEPMHPGPRIKNIQKGPPFEAGPSWEIEVEGYGGIRIPFRFRYMEAERILHRIVQEYKEAEHGYSLVLRGLLMQLITDIVRHEIDVSAPYPSKQTMISNALQMIQEHPQQAWSISQLAKSCGYHPNYFSHLFKEVMGISPKSYMIQKRMQWAKKLLLEEEKIEVVASKLGYTSIHYFSRHFKSITGMAPSTYRLYGGEDHNKL
ncbi:AraC family transcriptional regulator [Paenibacillus daejeonensis]|uniref:AraC family transcriptional regulator n=1 Tax=Paenibacillus daejeonensis TaxID=135193 RepID=UPI00036477DA|nr:AraC family transcriptional regulator [Paenibacillus daejeonensis]